LPTQSREAVPDHDDIQRQGSPAQASTQLDDRRGCRQSSGQLPRRRRAVQVATLDDHEPIREWQEELESVL
jgi:hypothetical protein